MKSANYEIQMQILEELREMNKLLRKVYYGDKK
jgi:hypothetical protein